MFNIINFTFVEDELLTLAEKLKPDIKERMKIEMAPWAKAYAVDMDKLYTEITLEKIENEPSGPTGIECTEYTKLFEDTLISTTDSANVCSTTKKPVRKKVLVKGDPGKGKTTLMKKMGWDWV